MPSFKNECSGCLSLGGYTHKGAYYDLYWCDQSGAWPTVVARYGNDPQAYESGMPYYKLASASPLQEARRRALAVGLRIE